MIYNDNRPVSNIGINEESDKIMSKLVIDGKNNICGKEIARRRNLLTPYVSQNQLAAKLQLMGLDFHKNSIQQIESGRRYVTDIELIVFARFFDTSVDELIGVKFDDIVWTSK